MKIEYTKDLNLVNVTSSSFYQYMTNETLVNDPVYDANFTKLSNEDNLIKFKSDANVLKSYDTESWIIGINNV